MQLGWRWEKVRRPMMRRPVAGGTRQDAPDRRLPALGIDCLASVPRLALAADLVSSLYSVGEERLEQLRTTVRDEAPRRDRSVQERPLGACRRCGVRRSDIDTVGIESVLPVGGSDIWAGANGFCRLQGFPQAGGNREGIPGIAGNRATCHHRSTTQQHQDGPLDGRTPRVTYDSTEQKTTCLGYADARHRPALRSEVKFCSPLSVTTGESATPLDRCQESRSPINSNFRYYTEENSQRAPFPIRRISLVLHPGCVMLTKKIPQSSRKTVPLRSRPANCGTLVRWIQSKSNHVGPVCAIAFSTITE